MPFPELIEKRVHQDHFVLVPTVVVEGSLHSVLQIFLGEVEL